MRAHGWRVAEWHAPRNVAASEIERDQFAIRRLHDGEPAHPSRARVARRRGGCKRRAANRTDELRIDLRRTRVRARSIGRSNPRQRRLIAGLYVEAARLTVERRP